MENTHNSIAPEQQECSAGLRPVHDALEFLGGKWKLHILGAMFKNGKLRFREMERAVNGITPKMLSKELQDLEMNKLITRKVLNTKPVSVEYELTEYAETLKPVLEALGTWGAQHRALLMSKPVQGMLSPTA